MRNENNEGTIELRYKGSTCSRILPMLENFLCSHEKVFFLQLEFNVSTMWFVRLQDWHDLHYMPKYGHVVGGKLVTKKIWPVLFWHCLQFIETITIHWWNQSSNFFSEIISEDLIFTVHPNWILQKRRKGSRGFSNDIRRLLAV